jgi:hypothetical protein
MLLMREVEATVSMGEGWTPQHVTHLQLLYRWKVKEVLDAWVHPGLPARTYGRQLIERRYRLRVVGPLPGRPRQHGEFIMIVTAYGHRHRFWIRPENTDR